MVVFDYRNQQFATLRFLFSKYEFASVYPLFLFLYLYLVSIFSVPFYFAQTGWVSVVNALADGVQLSLGGSLLPPGTESLLRPTGPYGKNFFRMYCHII